MHWQCAFLHKLRRQQQPVIVKVPGGDLPTLTSNIIHVELKIKLEHTTTTTNLLCFMRNTTVTKEHNLIGGKDIHIVPVNEAPLQTIQPVWYIWAMGEGGKPCEGVAASKVGEKKDRECDVLHATRMAVEGIRPGGGVILLKAPPQSLPIALEEPHLSRCHTPPHIQLQLTQRLHHPVSLTHPVCTILHHVGKESISLQLSLGWEEAGGQAIDCWYGGRDGFLSTKTYSAPALCHDQLVNL